MIKHIALTACSDQYDRDNLPKLVQTLAMDGLHAKLFISRSEVPPIKKAQLLRAAFSDPQAQAVFDISGGDTANTILPHLTDTICRAFSKPFYGYSDVSVILNALCPYTDVYYYQMRYFGTNAQSQADLKSLLSNELPPLREVEHIRGEGFCGDVAGGNLRCILKLMGTPYAPDFTDKIVFLEALSGFAPRIHSMLEQLSQCGAFSAARGVLLGQFTSLSEQDGGMDWLFDTIQDYLPVETPIAYAPHLGHSRGAQALPYRNAQIL